MPIVDGQYQAKISTTFSSTAEAIAEIKKKLEKSRRVRISNIPTVLLKKLLPLLKDKDVKIILPAKENPTVELKQIGPVAVQKAKIYKDHKGTEANLGGIYFSDRVFDVAWYKDKILQIDAIDYNKCVKCMRDVFEMGWRYSEKQK